MIEKIISGGQTGVDRAALDLAIELNIPHGGWIPKGRLTENGPLPSKYQLTEMPTPSYPKRTAKNVIESDGTLILSKGELTGGTLLTRVFAVQFKRPYLHIDLQSCSHAADYVIEWIRKNEIHILNIAGPRASSDATIYSASKVLLKAVIMKYRHRPLASGT